MVNLLWKTTRLTLAILSFWAVFLQALYLIQLGRFELAGFLSFFTIQANLFVIAVLLIETFNGCGISIDRRASLRGAAVLYLAITGIVYAVLLSKLPIVKEIVHPVADAFHHVIMPTWVLFDWVANPPSHRITVRRALWWFVYPLTYLFVSLIRGAITGWYPYPFLNPASPGGWLGIVTVSFACLILGYIILLGIIRLQPRNQD
ncbi:MAG: hypothetical protein RL240_2924 [Planctomycetota bacterium]|jgi:hypothetical protein